MKQCVTSQCKQVMTPKAKRPAKATQEFLRTENEQTFQLKKTKTFESLTMGGSV